MTDLDLLTGAIAARLRLLPEVARLYPTRTGLEAIAHSVNELLDTVADDPTVVIRPADDGYRVETSVGLTAEAAGPAAGAAIAAAVREIGAGSGERIAAVRVRISSVD